MSDRREDVKKAFGAVGNLLFGTKKQAADTVKKIAEDVEDQVKSKRGINTPAGALPPKGKGRP